MELFRGNEKALEQAEQNLIPLVLTKREQFVYRSIRYHGKTQKELAARLGIAQPTVSRSYCRACDKIQPLLNIITQAVKECVIDNTEFDGGF